MSEMQKYRMDGIWWVRHEEAVAAVAEERENAADYWGNRAFDHYRDGLIAGRAEALYRAREAVAAAHWTYSDEVEWLDAKADGLDPTQPSNDAIMLRREALAAIDALKTSLPASDDSAAPVLPTSVAPAGEDYGALAAEYQRGLIAGGFAGAEDALDRARDVVLENAAAHERLELPWYAEVLRAVASQIDALKGKVND